MNWYKYICIAFLSLVCTKLAAQSLRGLQENLVIKKHLADHPYSLKSATDVPLLSLPFFEDFSTSSVFPDPDKWADRYAFINTSFAVDPISIGVATLDAIDENGDVYAITDLPTSSDKLTSLGFDLSSYTFPHDTVRLSFFYQCGGNGEVPELTDSLLLEYFSPATGKWQVAWFASLNKPTTFQQIILDVPGIYYQIGFRFRFRNYTSISASEVTGGKGALSNADCWNIDYIMMNTNPVSEHHSINDITLVDPPRRLMSFYEIVPWLHLNKAQSITRNYINFTIRNLQKDSTFTVGRSYYVKDLHTGIITGYDLIDQQFEPDSIYRRNDPFLAPFVRNDSSAEGKLEVVSYLNIHGGQFKPNDSARIILDFKDFYAYDDGTPEYGFGISGPSMAGALLALRFRIYKPDTLRAVDMLFNKTRENFNANLKFHLCVWKDDNGKPGDLIFISPEEYIPGAESTMPGFKRYAINSDEDLIITDTVIYVGLKQLSEEFINLGYDVNRNNLDRTFVNGLGDWFNPGGSIIPGTVMIRAVFGSKKVITGNDQIPETTPELLLFPNPVSGMLNIETNGTLLNYISIYDIAGRLLLQQDGGQNYIDVSKLSSGIYQVVLTTAKNQRINQKIIVSH
jgi:hypothetical protein